MSRVRRTRCLLLAASFLALSCLIEAHFLCDVSRGKAGNRWNISLTNGLIAGSLCHLDTSTAVESAHLSGARHVDNCKSLRMKREWRGRRVQTCYSEICVLDFVPSKVGDHHFAKHLGGPPW